MSCARSLVVLLATPSLWRSGSRVANAYMPGAEGLIIVTYAAQFGYGATAYSPLTCDGPVFLSVLAGRSTAELSDLFCG